MNAPRKHSLDDKKTASVLLKMFISGNEGRHFTYAPKRMTETHFPM